MTGRFFADTNLAVYTLDVDPVKREKALTIMRSRPFISAQVVNEFLVVAMGKLKIPRLDANHLAGILASQCVVTPVTLGTINHAMQIGSDYSISHWDALIVASALDASCSTLYTEDMQHGQVIDGRLTIINPFI